MYLHGIEQLEKADRFLSGKRIGFVTNYTAVDRNLRRSADLLHTRYGLTRLFSPEHGLYGVAQAGEEVENETDRKTGLPVVSLFGGKTDRSQWLQGLDVVAFEIQDIGVRPYTYITVLAEVMAECAKSDIPLVLFDRCNPLGLTKRAGTFLDEKFSSFVGKYALPLRHGLTIGEYARYINTERNIGCDLHVIPCAGLTRDDDHRSLNLPWIYPSPNIPTYETALIYTGTVLFEGTNVSEGRGTTRPFSLIGAPWIDADHLTDAINSREFAGVKCRSTLFRPTFSKYRDEVCEGVDIIVNDPAVFEPCSFALTLAETIRALFPEFSLKPSLSYLLGTDAFTDPAFHTDAFLEKEAEKIREFSSLVKKYELYF